MINPYSRFGFFFPILPKDGTETNKNTGQIQPKAITPHLTCGQEAFSWSASLKEGPGARESHGISQWPIDGGKSMPCKFSLFKALAQWSKWNYFHDHFLVGGAITILKNMTSSMGRIIYIYIPYMKWKNMFETTNQFWTYWCPWFFFAFIRNHLPLGMRKGTVKTSPRLVLLLLILKLLKLGCLSSDTRCDARESHEKNSRFTAEKLSPRKESTEKSLL